MLCRLYGLHMGNSQHGCCVVQFKILCYYAINSYYPNMSLFTSFSVSKCIMGYIASIMTLFEYYTHVTHHLYGQESSQFVFILADSYTIHYIYYLYSTGVLNLFMVRANMKNGLQAGGHEFGQSRYTPCLHTKDLRADSDVTYLKFIYISKIMVKKQVRYAIDKF